MNIARLVCTVIVCAAALSAAKEFQANLRTANNQCSPAIAVRDDGGFVLVWTSYFSSGGRSNEIIVRPFDPNGAPLGVESQINTAGEGNQTEPAVAINGRGDLLVAWQGPGANGDEDIFARVFDSNGEPVTDELAVNVDPNGRQRFPAVAAAGEAFLVVWESQVPEGTEGNTTIRGQHFDPNGTPIGGELRIDDDVYDCRYPDVAVDAVGNAVVVWMQDRTHKTIHARLLDPNGVARSAPFAVNVDDIASVTHPSVATNGAGRFVVAWDGDPNLARLDDIHARCFEPNGAPRSDPFVVNLQCEGAQQWPRVAIGDANDFVIVWQHEHEDPNIATDIFARRFDSGGGALGGEIQLNSYVADKQRYPDVCMCWDGSYLAAWESAEQDGSGYGIFARVEPAVSIADPNTYGTDDGLTGAGALYRK